MGRVGVTNAHGDLLAHHLLRATAQTSPAKDLGGHFGVQLFWLREEFVDDGFDSRIRIVVRRRHGVV